MINGPTRRRALVTMVLSVCEGDEKRLPCLELSFLIRHVVAERHNFQEVAS